MTIPTKKRAHFKSFISFSFMSLVQSNQWWLPSFVWLCNALRFCMQGSEWLSISWVIVCQWHTRHYLTTI